MRALRGGSFSRRHIQSLRRLSAHSYKRVTRPSGCRRWIAATKSDDSESPPATGTPQPRPLLASAPPGAPNEPTERREKPPVKYSGLKGSPLSCGVNSATDSYELPTPAVAARNLVSPCPDFHLQELFLGYPLQTAERVGSVFCRYPFGALVDFVCDGSGFPVLRLSSLGVPTRNLMENPCCSLLIQMPGWSGISNTRLTIFGDIYQLPHELEPYAKELFLRQTWNETDILTGNTLYFRMHDIKDIYFVGGFGTVQWIDVQDYIGSEPDPVVTACTSAELQALNSNYVDDLRRVLSRRSPVHEVEIISVDAIGADVRTRTSGDYGVVRIGFDQRVSTVEDVHSALSAIIASIHKPKEKQN